MTIDCSEVPTNVTYDCANPWGHGCTSKKNFDFASLWQYTQNIQEACPTDPRLFLTDGKDATASNLALTQSACDNIAGAQWTEYPGEDIWTRMTTWKFPLLQLVFSFPRPPLSWRVQAFVIVHLLGDPIDTIQNLIFKMSTCEGLFLHLKEKYSRRPDGLVDTEHADEDLNIRRLALVADAYGEWSEDGAIKDFLDRELSRNKTNLEDVIKWTANALAADRSTKSLPIVIAMAFFIGTVGIAVFRTASAASADSDTIFINVEAHSIAFSALYFWIIPAVFLGSVIGVSQTEYAIPRILTRFRNDLGPSSLPTEPELPIINTEAEWRTYRIYCGGIYSWQPSEWQWQSSSASSTLSAAVPSRHGPHLTGTDSPPIPAGQSMSRQGSYLALWRRFNNALPPYIIVALGTATGMTVSALVPPDGWDCRHNTEIVMFTVWVLSAWCDICFNYWIPLSKHQFVSMDQSAGPRFQRPQTKSYSLLFYLTFFKDFLAMGLTMGLVIATQIGIFNRCECYTQWGRTGLALPKTPDVDIVLRSRLSGLYPAVTFTCIGVELIVVPALISWRYRHALGVFVQRDDEESNLLWIACCSLQKTSTAGLRKMKAAWRACYRLQKMKVAAARISAWKASMKGKYKRTPKIGNGHDTPLLAYGPSPANGHEARYP